MALVALATSRAEAQVPWAGRTSVDTDADGVPDVFDNAPNVSNPTQNDLDMDQIGDVIDPTPTSTGPFLGDLGLTIGGPYTIAAGAQLNIAYNVATPVWGHYGHIDLDLGGDGIFDATYFGSLDGTAGTINIGPGLHTDAFWDTNTPGIYTLKAQAFGPGGDSSILSATVTVVPEPGSALAIIIVLASGATMRRR
jgi:hypothetical protein